jgi:hypothetical protein
MAEHNKPTAEATSPPAPEDARRLISEVRKRHCDSGRLSGGRFLLGYCLPCAVPLVDCLYLKLADALESALRRLEGVADSRDAACEQIEELASQRDTALRERDVSDAVLGRQLAIALHAGAIDHAFRSSDLPGLLERLIVERDAAEAKGRREAFEEAARVCEAEAGFRSTYRESYGEGRFDCAESLAKRIRAKAAEPRTAGEE